MTFKEKWNLRFHKSECIHVSIVLENRRRIHKIVRVVNNQETFKINENDTRRYNIEYDLVVYDELGLPYLSYYFNNSRPIDFVMSKADEYTSSEFDDIFNIKIVEQLNEANKKNEGITVDKLVIIFGIINVLGLAVVGYLVYSGLEALNENYDAIKEFIELIRNLLVTNGEL